MFAILLVFAFVTANTLEIPSYMRVCGRKDPNYDECVKDNIMNIKDYLCKGIPEFNMSSIEPVTLDKAVIYDTDNLKLYIRDIKIYKFCDGIVHSVHTDSDRLHFDFDVTFNKLILDSFYDFDIHILVSLANKGRVFITANKLPVEVSMDLKVVSKNGKKQIYAWKVNSNLNLTSFEYTFDESEKELVQLHEVIRNVVDSNKQDVISSVKPVMEKKISQIIISIFNNLASSNYEKLFPEEA